MRAKPRAKTRPSKDQVRAWLTTVIAPMASALTVEGRRASRGDWSFRCETQDFEFLWPIEKTVATPYLPNLGQFLRHRSDVRELAHDHDGALDSLRAAAREAYDRLVNTLRFQRLASSTSVSSSDHQYFAEYIVNGIRDLASHYVHHDVWKREGEKFLELRQEPSLRPRFQALETAGQGFAKSVESLLKVVGALQVELSDKYKLPPVDPADAVRV